MRNPIPGRTSSHFNTRDIEIDCRVLMWKKTSCQNSEKFGYNVV